MEKKKKNHFMGLLFLGLSYHPIALGLTVKVHQNRFEALALGGHSFVTYETRLEHVKEFFSDHLNHLTLQRWNPRYERAREIFEDETKGEVAKKAIHRMHDHLYRSNPFKMHKEELSNGQDFLTLIRREDAPQRFTYVILPDGTFRFSETKNKKNTSHKHREERKNKFSKHAIHARAAEAVIYAGEFYVITKNRKETLVLDNNSGTYAPDENLLDSLRKLMESNFPDVSILTVDRHTHLDEI